MTETLYVCRSTSPLARAIFKPGVHVYLTRISRSGRTTRWSPDVGKALRVNAAKRDRMKEAGFAGRGFGRWVKAPEVAA